MYALLVPDPFTGTPRIGCSATRRRVLKVGRSTATMAPAYSIAWLMAFDRYHMLKKEILSVDACGHGGGAGLPIIEFTAYGKTAASMKCIKCKAVIREQKLS